MYQIYSSERQRNRNNNCVCNLATCDQNSPEVQSIFLPEDTKVLNVVLQEETSV